MARYERLMEISRQLNSTLDLGILLGRILAAATELTDTEEASILLLDPATGELRFEAASNLTRAEMEAIPVPMDSSLAGWVATHAEPVLVEDVRSDSRWFPGVDKTTEVFTRNLLAVPMNLQNKTIGVVEAHQQAPRSALDPGRCEYAVRARQSGRYRRPECAFVPAKRFYCRDGPRTADAAGRAQSQRRPAPAPKSG